MSSLLLPAKAVPAEDTEAPIRHFGQVLEAYGRHTGRVYELQYIPEHERVKSTIDQIIKPFRIVERSPALGEHIVRHLSAAEMKRPQDILAWLWEGDLARQRPNEVINRIELAERAEKAMRAASDDEERESRIDRMAYFLSGGRDRRHRLQYARGKYVNR